MERAVVTIMGKDKVGIVANISSVLASHNVNILDISQTIMQDLFAMIMLVDISQA
ncbi:MAG: ACT domain-containing protein, partial [bacterium]